MPSLKLKVKFTILAGLMFAAVVALLVLNSRASSVQAEQLKKLKMIAEITQHHMESDMMHDGIRADVLKYVLAKTNYNADDIKDAQDSLAEHSQIFSENIDANKKADLPENLKASLDEILTQVDAYSKAADAVMKAPSLEESKAKLPAFSEAFRVLEESMGAMSDDIGKWAEETEKDGIAHTESAQMVSLIIAGITLVITIIVPIFAILAVFKPQAKIIDSMKIITSGDYQTPVPFKDRKDEIGEIAKSVEVFRQNGIEKLQLEKMQEDQEIQAKEDRKKMMHQLADSFQNKVQAVVEAVAAAAEELCATAESMKNIVQQVSNKSRNASDASKRTLDDVRSVAAASEEMSASVREISEQVTRSNHIVSEAVQRTSEADISTSKLTDISSSIGKIVGVIDDIANQINLLALNATIESARAGEAGKGFAVVASEVKNLAQQTTSATEEISRQIQDVQSISKNVVSSLSHIKDSIHKVDDVTGSVSAAIEEQTAVTNEISSNMQAATGEVEGIGNDVNDVNASSESALAATTQVLSASKMLSQQSQVLSEVIEQFLKEVRT